MQKHLIALEKKVMTRYIYLVDKFPRNVRLARNHHNLNGKQPKAKILRRAGWMHHSV
jgi:hypothetical protein